MRTARGATPAPLLLVGAVRGLEAEVPRVLRALSEFGPERVALGLSPEEVKALREHFTDPRVEPWVPLSTTEVAYAQGLCLFGSVRVPSPAFVAAIRWAEEAGVPLEGVEPPDDEYSQLFLEHVGYLDLVRRTLAERKLVKVPPESRTATSFALEWEERSQAGKGSRDLGKARSRHLAERLRELHSSSGEPLKSRVALLVDVERFDPALHRLREAAWKDLSTGVAPDDDDRDGPDRASPLESGGPSPLP